MEPQNGPKKKRSSKSACDALRVLQQLGSSEATRTHRSVKDLEATVHILLTATPMINRPLDLPVSSFCFGTMTGPTSGRMSPLANTTLRQKATSVTRCCLQATSTDTSGYLTQPISTNWPPRQPSLDSSRLPRRMTSFPRFCSSCS